MSKDFDRRLPDFLIIGAMKAATTSVYDIVGKSPDVDLPKIKEPAILTDFNTKKDAQEAYFRHFRNSGDAKIVGEATTYYTMQPLFPEVANFAREVCGPDIKIIYITRNPVDRILSHVRHDFMVGRLTDNDLSQETFFRDRYLSVGRYGDQIRPWLSVFNRKQFLFISLEELVSNPMEVEKEIYSFLDIAAAADAIEEVHSNSNERLRAPRGGKLGQKFRESRVFRQAKKILPERVRSMISPIVTKSKHSAPITLDSDTRSRLHDYYYKQNEEFDALIKNDAVIETKTE